MKRSRIIRTWIRKPVTDCCLRKLIPKYSRIPTVISYSIKNVVLPLVQCPLVPLPKFRWRCSEFALFERPVIKLIWSIYWRYVFKNFYICPTRVTWAREFVTLIGLRPPTHSGQVPSSKCFETIEFGHLNSKHFRIRIPDSFYILSNPIRILI